MLSFVDILGARLESEKHGQLAINACLCYICAGNVEKLVQCWNKLNPKTTPTTLQVALNKCYVWETCEICISFCFSDI